MFFAENRKSHKAMSNGKGETKKKFAEVVIISLLLTLAHCICAQDKVSLQVKTFDQKLEPYRNIEVSIDGKEFINMGGKGVAFTELTGSDVSIKSIHIRNEQLEVASWNYSKGTLEIIVRNKNYQVIHLVVRDESGEVLPNLKVTFRGRKTITANTNRSGRLELPLALDEKLSAAGQFSVDGYTMSNLLSSAKENVLTIVPIKLPTQTPTKIAIVPKQLPNRSFFQHFDFSKLDSIRSLTVFYAVFKNYDRKQLSKDELRRIDNKFNELVSGLKNSDTKQPRQAFMGKITDSTFIVADIKSILVQVQQENQTLSGQRSEFDKKIRIINAKLKGGAAHLDEATRNSIINDLALLERLLIENENRFYKNESDYRALINAIKERFLNIQALEQELTASELQRLEEQRIFRQRLIIISAIVLVFGILIVLLIYFIRAIRKQKEELVAANAEITWINANLEGLVSKRTRLLETANKELDTFLYRASHDMRTPVRSIMGLCHLANKVGRGEIAEFVRRIFETTVSMDKLLKKLSIISEINQPTNLSSISIAASIDSVRKSLKNEIEVSGADFTTQYADDLVIESYPNLMNTIINNMIENAIFYSSLNGTTPKILVTAAYQGDKFCLRVQDNGIGISESMKARVFDMFFKGSEQSKGHGLGLYIVQKAVQALSGAVTVESNPGSSTTFTVMLPLTLRKLKQAG
jgi:signal transduction histidine kinase